MDFVSVKVNRTDPDEDHCRLLARRLTSADELLQVDIVDEFAMKYHEPDWLMTGGYQTVNGQMTWVYPRLAAAIVHWRTRFGL